MCLAVPGKVVKVEGETATVDFGGARRKVRLDLLSNVNIGEYVLVHAGYAIQILDEKAAAEMIRSWEKVAEVL